MSEQDESIDSLVQGFSSWLQLAAVLPIDDEAEKRISERLTAAAERTDCVYLDIQENKKPQSKSELQSKSKIKKAGERAKANCSRAAPSFLRLLIFFHLKFYIE